MPKKTAEAVTPTFRGGDLEVTTTGDAVLVAEHANVPPFFAEASRGRPLRGQRRGNSRESLYVSLDPKEALNPLLPRPKGYKDAEGMKKQNRRDRLFIRLQVN
jgi:hypothetical protein